MRAFSPDFSGCPNASLSRWGWRLCYLALRWWTSTSAIWTLTRAGMAVSLAVTGGGCCGDRFAVCGRNKGRGTCSVGVLGRYCWQHRAHQQHEHRGDGRRRREYPARSQGSRVWTAHIRLHDRSLQARRSGANRLAHLFAGAVVSLRALILQPCDFIPAQKIATTAATKPGWQNPECTQGQHQAQQND